MGPWLPSVLAAIHKLTAAGRIRFTQKARREMGRLLFGFRLLDAVDVVSGLEERDFVERVKSPGRDEWLYVFKPEVFDLRLYVKMAIRLKCVVISFHADAVEGIGEDE